MLRESTCETHIKEIQSVIVTGAPTVTYCTHHRTATGSMNDMTYSNTSTQPCQICDDTYHPVGIIYSIHVNFCYKSNSRGCVWVSGSTFHFQTVYPVLIIGLKQTNKKKQRNIKTCDQLYWNVNRHAKLALLTLAGPMIMPVHRVRVMSSSSSRPQLTVPSPSPFCPSSSSSNKRKLRGTLTKTTKTEHGLHRLKLYLCIFYIFSYRLQIPKRSKKDLKTIN